LIFELNDLSIVPSSERAAQGDVLKLTTRVINKNAQLIFQILDAISKGYATRANNSQQLGPSWARGFFVAGPAISSANALVASFRLAFITHVFKLDRIVLLDLSDLRCLR
jgi:hypothetical protein